MARPLLLVEDNEDDIFFMEHAMKKAGIDNPLAIAKDGREAIELLERALGGNLSDIPVPRLIFLDLKLPRVPGLDVLKWIRGNPRLKTVPVLVLTASKQDQDVEAAYNLGANSFFTKPANTDTLVEMMRVIKDYWLTHCVPPPICITE